MCITYIYRSPQLYTGLILPSQGTQLVQEICIERDECTVGLGLIQFFTKYKCCRAIVQAVYSTKWWLTCPLLRGQVKKPQLALLLSCWTQNLALN